MIYIYLSLGWLVIGFIFGREIRRIDKTIGFISKGFSDDADNIDILFKENEITRSQINYLLDLVEARRTESFFRAQNIHDCRHDAQLDAADTKKNVP